MQQKIHMHDQVFNKVEDIMNHYKRNPIEGLMRLLKLLINTQSIGNFCLAMAVFIGSQI